MPFVTMLHTICSKKIIGMCGWYECELVTQLIEFLFFLNFQWQRFTQNLISPTNQVWKLQNFLQLNHTHWELSTNTKNMPQYFFKFLSFYFIEFSMIKLFNIQ